MFGGNQESDKSLLKAVNKRLERTGTQTRLTATVQRGTVTLCGKLQYENQRLNIVKAVQSVSGVRGVVDQLQAPPKTRGPMSQYAAAAHISASNPAPAPNDSPAPPDDAPAAEPAAAD
jgi:osmotically-inducible protein OsmY